MTYIYNPHTNVHFNLAAEEYLLEHFDDKLFMLWQNKPAVVIGKYQNILAEINVDFIRANQIKVVRRITGGGAVYHDLGNLNFTFIEKNETGDYTRFNEQILTFLIKLGVPANLDERNNLMIKGLKVSGSAECIRRNRLMHHGTLLFSSVLSDLNAALRVDPIEQIDRYVKSVRSPVTNISDYLNQPIDIHSFKEALMLYFLENTQDKPAYHFSVSDIEAINRLSKEKYQNPDWNFGTPFRRYKPQTVS